MKFLGHLFTDRVSFVRDKNGPISYDIYRSSQTLKDMGLIDIKTQEGSAEYGYPRLCHSLRSKLPNLNFTDSEIIYLNSILDDYLGLTIKKLKEITYHTEPMLEMLKQEKSQGVTLLKGERINFNSIALDEDILTGMMTS